MTTLLVVLAACVPASPTPRDVETFRLTLVPHVLEGQAPLRGEASLVLQDPDGAVTEIDLGAPEGAVEVPVVPALAPGTSVGLVTTDGGSAVGWGEVVLPDGLSSGDATAELLVTEVGHVGEVGGLGRDDASIWAAVAVVPGGDAWFFGGVDADAADDSDGGSTDVIRHLSGLDTEPAVDAVDATVPAGEPVPPGDPMSGRVGAAALAVTTADGVQILVTGGRGNFIQSQGGTASAFLFDPASAEVVWEGEMTWDRSEHTLLALADGRVLVVGGFQEGSVIAPTFEIFDPDRLAFTDQGDLDVGELRSAAAATSDGGALVCGGADYNSYGTWTPTADCDRIEPDGAVVAAAPVPVAVAGHAMAALPGDRVLLVGGYSDAIEDQPPYDHGTAPATGLAFVWDAATDTWTEAGSLAIPRAHHAAVPLADGSVVVFGGSAEGHGAFGRLDAPVRCPERYDPDAAAFTSGEGCGAPGSGADPAWGAWPGEDIVVLEGWTRSTTGYSGGVAYGVIGTGRPR